jgi:hypothetical protein
MVEGVKSPGLKVRVLFVLAAMVLGIFVANALFNAPAPMGTKEADAALNWRPIEGNVYHYNWSTGQTWRAPNAFVRLYRYSQSDCPLGTGTLLPSTTADSTAHYRFPTVATGYWYRVYAQRAGYGGWTGCFPLGAYASGPVYANVLLTFPLSPLD